MSRLKKVREKMEAQEKKDQKQEVYKLRREVLTKDLQIKQYEQCVDTLMEKLNFKKGKMTPIDHESRFERLENWDDLQKRINETFSDKLGKLESKQKIAQERMAQNLQKFEDRMSRMDKQINKVKKDLKKGLKDTKKLLKMDKKFDAKLEKAGITEKGKKK